MAFWRKKPLVVEMWHFTDGNKDRVHNDLRAYHSGVCPAFRSGKPVLLIPTLEGEMAANLGDYIIKGVHGELYPCKPDIFLETYEPMEV